MSNDGVPFHYPERIKETFLKFGPNIWRWKNGKPCRNVDFLTEEAPRRFPGAFSHDRFSGGLSPDIEFFAGLKQYYWAFSVFDRIKKQVKDGCPMVAVQAGSPLEIYFAANCLPVEPGFPVGWLLQQSEGHSRQELQQLLVSIRNMCKKDMPAECCSIVAPFHAVHSSHTPIEFIAPMTMTACSDAMFTMESARRNEGNIPAYVVDFPVNNQAGRWRVEYLAEQFRILAAKLGQLRGVAVTDEVLAEEIRRQNLLRRQARAATEMWWKAPVPRPIAVIGGCWACVQQIRSTIRWLGSW